MSLPPSELPEAARRRPIGRPEIWAAIAATLVLMAGLQLYGIARPEEITTDRARLNRMLRDLQTEHLMLEATTRDPEATAEKTLDRMQERLAGLDLETKGAKGVAARAALILRQRAHPNSRPDFTGLNTETDDITGERRRQESARHRARINAALKEVYVSRRLTRGRADELKATLSKGTGAAWPLPLAMERADELAGRDKKVRSLAAAAAIAAVLFGGLAAWAVYLGLRLSGRQQPRGIPLQGASPLVADSLGARAFAYLLLFVTVPVLFSGLIRLWLPESFWASVLAMTAVLLVALSLSARPLFGIKLRLSDIGLRTRKLGREVLWGVGAWFANWPVLAVLIPLGIYLSRWIPSAEHPVQQQLSEPGSLIPILIGTVLIGPFAEEFFFRGCLYQGLQLRMRSVFGAVFLSSVAFAAIHPQGGGGWLGLGWVGAMAALLTRETGSLVPAMVMHSLHNASIVLGATFLAL